MPGLIRYAGEDFGALTSLYWGPARLGTLLSVPLFCVAFGNGSRFVGSDVTADFERALPELNWRCSWDDSTAGAGLRLCNCWKSSVYAMAMFNLP